MMVLEDNDIVVVDTITTISISLSHCVSAFDKELIMNELIKPFKRLPHIYRSSRMGAHALVPCSGPGFRHACMLVGYIIDFFFFNYNSINYASIKYFHVSYKYFSVKVQKKEVKATPLAHRRVFESS